jgi:hypothetical protein
MFPLSRLASVAGFDVHAASTSVHRGRCPALNSSSRRIRMLASVAREVTVMAVDHGQAGAHVAGQIEGGNAGTQHEGSEGVSEIVDPAQRLDPGGELRWLPLAVGSAASRGEQRNGEAPTQVAASW